MKPQLINCGNNCKWCDGYGIMSFEYGPIKMAPCLECSPTKNLTELMRQRNKALMAFEKAKELEEIDKHNKRIAGVL